MPEPWEKGLLAPGWTLRRAVELAIVVEETGNRLYLDLAAKWSSRPELRELFTRLAGEEVAHREGLRSLLAGAAAERSEAQLNDDSLKAIAQASFFGESGALGVIRELSAPPKILEAVLGFEVGTVLYYRGLRDVLGPNATLDAIIKEERRHTATVMRALQDLSRQAPVRAIPVLAGV
jgi:hypothetical protein